MLARVCVTIALLMALAAPVANAQTAGSPVGVWLTQAGDARVRVSKCGEALCGVVVWLREPTNPATGQPQVDDKNPNPSLARRPMIGLPLFTDMRITGPNKWSGHIYNADDGGTYLSNISVAVRTRCASKAASACCAAERRGPGRPAERRLTPPSLSARSPPMRSRRARRR